MTVEWGFIGGSGLYDPGFLSAAKEETVATEYGDAWVTLGLAGTVKVVFIPRHGKTHSLPPHRINYRANIRALQSLGVKRVVATNAVGSLNPAMKPGDLVVLDQFIDFTKDRPSSFFTGGDEGVVHTDMTEPYCRAVRQSIIQAASKLELSFHATGTYVCTEGPRFETPAEIRMFRQWGGDLVGMTNYPEVALAREAGLCYGTVAMVTNFAAGISRRILSHEEVLEEMSRGQENLRRLIAAIISGGVEDNLCCCPSPSRPIST